VTTVDYGDFEWDATKAAPRMLFVVFAERGERIRIISARRAKAAQRKKYEEDT
jgi:uncharacterized DUF497 family protein